MSIGWKHALYWMFQFWKISESFVHITLKINFHYLLWHVLQFQSWELVRNEIKYIISLNFSFLSPVYLAMYCYYKDKVVIALLYFERVYVQVFSPIQ